ncbi:hypothetical protein FRC10_000963 [Ceratobasidium sp. 414]|nr:hypothetical protein FRC10_000963 [Ceratobasidium sp. 414]
MESRRPSKLEDLPKQDLIARIYALEAQLPPSSRHPHRRRETSTKPFAFHAHPTRKVAFKFSYAGWAYNGLAAQSQPTPLPTVEQALFDAFVATRLVDPAGGMDGCGWSRCGRTDRGVSAAGQVVSLRVRSAVGERPVLGSEARERVEVPVQVQESAVVDGDVDLPMGLASPGSSRSSTPPPTTEPRPELAYIHILNRVLPPTIRILAWSPVSDTFDARFSCQYRHYKYLFPRGGRTGDALDIAAMRDAARRLVGEHDFRNFCKLDPSKQIENFSRRVVGAWIERVDRDSFEDGPEQDSAVGSEATEEMWVFNLKGTAFLWHQVRCIMAVLFLVGSKLERPDIVDYLLHTTPTSAKSSSLPDSSPPIESKPNYTMADALPLVLWDCGYRSEDVAWQMDGQVEIQGGAMTDRERTHNFWFQLYSVWTHDQIQAAMQGYFLRAGEAFYPRPSPVAPGLADSTHGPVKLNMGGGVFRHMSKYVPVLELDRGERAEVANLRWREGAAGMRRMAKRDEKKGQVAESVHED